MPMVVVVTRNALPRTRGFLASVMCEIAPGVYTADLNARVRDRVWTVMERWFVLGSEASVVMTWPDAAEPGGQGIRSLGVPRYEAVPIQGMISIRRELTEAELRSLKTEKDK